MAELSANHGGNLERAVATIHAAADSGADAIKIQTYTADSMTLDCDGPEFLIAHGPWAGRRLFELYEEAHTPWGLAWGADESGPPARLAAFFHTVRHRGG